MLSLQIQVRKNPVKDVNCHQMIYPIQRQIHVVITIIRRAQRTIIIKIWEMVIYSIKLFF